MLSPSLYHLVIDSVVVRDLLRHSEGKAHTKVSHHRFESHILFRRPDSGGKIASAFVYEAAPPFRALVLPVVL